MKIYNHNRQSFLCLATMMVAAAIMLGGALPAFAEDAAGGGGGGLHVVDWLVIILYGAAMVVIGWRVGKKHQSSDDYYIGGGRLKSSVVGISLFATLLSTISYLGFPGEMINKGPTILIGILSLPIIYLVVGYWLIPKLMATRITSAYEMLEERLGLAPRMMTVAMFLALRLIWMGLMVHVASIAVVTMLGLGKEHVIWVVIVCSFIAIAYTAVGGLRAVVITDVAQFVILLLGALFTIGIISMNMGGFSWFPTEWSPSWDEQPFISFDPKVRVTVVGTLVSYAIWWIATAGADQTAIQRFMSTGSAENARKSFLVNAWADALVTLVLGLVGFALLGFYTANPQLAGDSLGKADKLFPLYIAGQLPPVIRGLVIAAMFAAVMSSLDSGINSATAVVQVDIIDRFFGSSSNNVPGDESNPSGSGHSLKTARILSVAIGVMIVVLNTTLMPNIPGNIMKMTQTTVNLLVCPMFGVFLLALFVPRATSFGAVVGTCYAVGVAVLIGFWDSLRPGADPLSFQWIGPCALIVSLVVAIPVSRLPSPRRAGLYLAATLLAIAPLAVVFYFVAIDALMMLISE